MDHGKEKNNGGRPVPKEITALMAALDGAKGYGKELSAVGAEELGELFFGIDWGAEGARPFLAAYRRDAEAHRKEFTPWIPHPIPELPDAAQKDWDRHLKPISGSVLYEWLERNELVKEFRYLIRCCCWWWCCKCDCWPPRWCRSCCCCYHTIRVYPKAGITDSAVYARTLRFHGVTVEAGSPESEAEITIPPAGPHALSDTGVHTGRLSVAQLPDGVMVASDYNAAMASTDGTTPATIDGYDVSALGAKLAGIEAGAEKNDLTSTQAAELTEGGLTALHTHRISSRHTATGGAFGPPAVSGPSITLNVGPWTNVTAADIHVAFCGMVDTGTEWLPLTLGEWSAVDNPTDDSIDVYLRVFDANGARRTSTDTLRYRLDVYA